MNDKDQQEALNLLTVELVKSPLGAALYTRFKFLQTPGSQVEPENVCKAIIKFCQIMAQELINLPTPKD